MALNKSKAYVTVKGASGPISVYDMEKLFQKELAQQTADMMEGVENGQLPQGQKWGKVYGEKLKNLKTELNQIVEDTISDNLNARLIETVVSGTVKDVYLVSNSPFNSEGAFGYFIEEKLFGLQKDNKGTADLDTYRRQRLSRKKSIEIKATGQNKDDLQVGGITVYGLDKIDAIEMETLKYIVIIYKMMIKMQHFLYINTRQQTEPSGRTRIGFRAMILYTELYLKALLDWSQKKNSDFAITAKGAANLKPSKVGYQISYEISIGMSSTSTRTGGVITTISGIDRIKKLYLTHIDMINEIDTGGISAAEFFGKLRKLGGAVIVK